MKVFITFGIGHAHAVNGQTFDKDCVAAIEADDHEHGRKLAFEWFGDKFFTSYSEQDFDQENMRFFPRGVINVN